MLNEFRYNTNESNTAEPETNKDPVKQENEDEDAGIPGSMSRNLEPVEADRQEQETQPCEEDGSPPARNTSGRELANRAMSRSNKEELTQYSRRLDIATWAQQVSASSYFNTTRQDDVLPCLDDPPSATNMVNNPGDYDSRGRGLSMLPQPAPPPRVADNSPPLLHPMPVHSYPYPGNEASLYHAGANRGPTEPPTESFLPSRDLARSNPQEPHPIYPTPTQGLYVTWCSNPPYAYALSQTAHENPELAFDHHTVAFSETITTTRTVSGDVTKTRRRQWVVAPKRYSPY
ncbi:hypothetical protein CPC08DRAFT_789996 [Agrocybe pediades]|nr:hypothetical protein CPC08DRAFT_789996 [Agrocybe pediades]